MNALRFYLPFTLPSIMLFVNLSILNHFNYSIMIFVNSGLIEIFLFSNCFTYILEGDVSNWMRFVFLPNKIELTASIEFDWFD